MLRARLVPTGSTADPRLTALRWCCWKTNEDLFGLKGQVESGDGAIRAGEQQMPKPPWVAWRGTAWLAYCSVRAGTSHRQRGQTIE